ncbi:hypothetical protein [Microbacterium sp. NPDC057944]|uniref:hypothetical protein n=1 Tax=Microbacterium sp. NPDC057944 TaxID=3346286 RepID=UPI0036D8DF33
MNKTLLGVIAAALVCVGAAAGVLVATMPLPSSLEKPVGIDAVPVSERPFSDERSIGVTVDYGPTRAFIAPRGGIVTGASCMKGADIVSGTSPFHLDGAPVIALATALPLWRDISVGMTGPDVGALRDELSRLGLGIDPGDRFTAATLAAYRALITAAGGSAKGVDGVSLSSIAWLPSTSIPASGCPVALGSQVGQGGVLADLPSLVLGAHVTPLPDELAPGARTVRIDDQDFSIDEDGDFAASDLDRLAATPSYSAARAVSESEKVKGTLRLAEAVTVFAVPPRAVVESGDVFCVIDDGGAVPVTVLASQLGMTFVRPVAAGVSLTEVDLDPSSKTTCD